MPENFSEPGLDEFPAVLKKATRRRTARTTQMGMLKPNPKLQGAARPRGKINFQTQQQLLSQSAPNLEDLIEIRRKLRADNAFLALLLDAS
jgi:hypothetical protein